MLRLLNLPWLPKPAGRVAALGPGFPGLEELCLASSACSSVSDEVLGRLLHSSPNLRLLDLRGCARITPAGLDRLPCWGLLLLRGVQSGKPGGGLWALVWLTATRPRLQSWSSFTWACMV